MLQRRNDGCEVLVSRACLWRRLKSNARKLILRSTRQRLGLRPSSGAFLRGVSPNQKRQRTGAVQNLAALRMAMNEAAYRHVSFNAMTRRTPGRTAIASRKPTLTLVVALALTLSVATPSRAQSAAPRTHVIQNTHLRSEERR